MTYTITRRINGVKTEIKLTSKEVRDIYLALQNVYDRNDVERFCEDYAERGDQPLTKSQKEDLIRKYRDRLDDSEEWWNCLENCYYDITHNL